MRHRHQLNVRGPDVYLFELSRERYWFAPDRTGAGPPFMKHPIMIREFRYGVVNARVPQEPPLGVMDHVAVAGKVDRGPDVDSWCPTRFVRATAVAAVNHVESVYSGIGRGGNSHARRGGHQRHGGSQEDAFTIHFH